MPWFQQDLLSDKNTQHCDTGYSAQIVPDTSVDILNSAHTWVFISDIIAFSADSEHSPEKIKHIKPRFQVMKL